MVILGMTPISTGIERCDPEVLLDRNGVDKDIQRQVFVPESAIGFGEFSFNVEEKQRSIRMESASPCDGILRGVNHFIAPSKHRRGKYLRRPKKAVW